jgi:hypothetical protein
MAKGHWGNSGARRFKEHEGILGLLVQDSNQLPHRVEFERGLGDGVWNGDFSSAHGFGLVLVLVGV